MKTILKPMWLRWASIKKTKIRWFRTKWYLGFVQVDSHVITNVCVKLQERCNINKLKSIEDDNNMLFSNKLHSFGLTTHTIEAHFVASRVIKFQETSQFASRAWNKHTEMLFHREYQYKTSKSKPQTYNFVKPDVAQLNGLFCRLSRCSSKVGKGRLKLIFWSWFVKERSFP